MTEKDIIARVLSGHREAYAELVRTHHAKIIGLCRSMLGNRADAEDAAQEVFIKAFRSLDRFTGASSFSTWIHRIASNQCLDVLRRKSRDKTESLDVLLDKGDSAARESLSMPPDTGPSMENADLAERALRGLSPDHRLILTLREVQGLNYKEIAETLECSLDAVKARLKRARQAVEKTLRHFSTSDNV